MKKLLLVLGLVVVAAGSLASCKSAHACPAYSKAKPAQVERPA